MRECYGAALNDAERLVITWALVLGSYFVELGRRILDGKSGVFRQGAPSLIVVERNTAALLLSLSNQYYSWVPTKACSIGKPGKGYNVTRVRP